MLVYKTQTAQKLTKDDDSDAEAIFVELIGGYFVYRLSYTLTKFIRNEIFRNHKPKGRT